MMYVLHDGTGLSREDCLHWSKPLRKAAADPTLKTVEGAER